MASNKPPNIQKIKDTSGTGLVIQTAFVKRAILEPGLEIAGGGYRLVLKNEENIYSRSWPHRAENEGSKGLTSQKWKDRAAGGLCEAGNGTVGYGGEG